MLIKHRFKSTPTSLMNPTAFSISALPVDPKKSVIGTWWNLTPRADQSASWEMIYSWLITNYHYPSKTSPSKMYKNIEILRLHCLIVFFWKTTCRTRRFWHIGNRIILETWSSLHWRAIVPLGYVFTLFGWENKATSDKKQINEFTFIDWYAAFSSNSSVQHTTPPTFSFCNEELE